MSAASRRRVAAVRLLLSLLVALALAAGCGLMGGSGRTGAAAGRDEPAPAPPTSGPDAFERSGRGGQIRLTLPDGEAARPYPLVVALHSLYHDGSEPQNGWGLAELARSAGFAVVYPDGLDLSWNAGTCCGSASASGVDDVAWLRSLIAHLESRYPIDPRRVSIIGLSNGGMLAYRYACEHGDELAGFAAVAASLQIPNCIPPAPLTTVTIHGGQDGHVPYAGALWSEALQTGITPADVSLGPFRSVDGCPPPTQPGDTSYTGADGLPLGTNPDPGGLAAPAAGPAGGAAAIIAATGPNGQAVPPVPPSTSPQSLPPQGAPLPATQPVAIRHETVCATSARLVQYLLPDLGHGWPALTGPAAFDTAAVLWSLLREARSATTGPRM